MELKSYLHKCLTPYRELVSDVDRHLNRIQHRYAGHIACHMGCACGCRNLSISFMEALSLANAVQDLPRETAAKIKMRAAAVSFWECPLLEERACRLYPFRPMICRTHGFPLQTIFNGRSSIGHCRHNFKNISSIPEDAVIDLDKINRMLRAINTSVMDKSAHVMPLPDRLTISEAIQLEIR